ncbi:MAG: diacylglycerol/lipid kinase family protein [Wenzhouxiangella sp.]
MSECQWSFIINPSAGARSARGAERLIEQIRVRFPASECLLTRQPGDALDWARARRGDANRVVVAVGGDGTVNAVARGLAGGCAQMAVVPAGSGNDFARMLGMPKRLHAGLAALPETRPVAVDFAEVCLVRVDGTRLEAGFVNSLGLGLEARIARRAGQARLLRGFPRYLVAALIELLVFTPPELLIQWPDKTLRQRSVLLAVANGRWAGGGFKLAPEARLDSGCLVLTRADPMPLWRLLSLLPTTLWGGHVGKAGVHQCSVQQLRVDCETGMAVHLDGEVVAGLVCRLEIRVRPGGLQVRSASGPALAQ